jgi:hypothetical protein
MADESRLERHLRPLVREPGLRLLLIAGTGIFVTFGAWMLAGALRSRSVPAIAATLLLLLASAEAVRSDVRRSHRPGVVSGLIAALWLLSALGALAGTRFGLL